MIFDISFMVGIAADEPQVAAWCWVPAEFWKSGCHVGRMTKGGDLDRLRMFWRFVAQSKQIIRWVLLFFGFLQEILYTVFFLRVDSSGC